MRAEMQGGTVMAEILRGDTLHAVYDVLAFGVCIVDSDQDECVLFANRAILSDYECGTEAEFMEFCGGRFSGMTMDPNLHLYGMAAPDGPAMAIQYSYRTRSGKIREAESFLTYASMDGRPVLVLQIGTRDAGRMSYISDELTGLPGEKSFYHSAIMLANTMMDRQEFTHFCPVYFNISNFRSFNRKFGISAGDRALRFVADTLRQEFPGSLIAHFEADHFAAILPRGELQEKIEKSAAMVDEYLGGGAIALKAGIVIFDREVHREQLLHSFDMAKIACASVRNKPGLPWAVFTEEMTDQIEKRQYILDHFESALKEGRIKVYYQPVVRMLSGKICSFEALARWEDPENGFISPGIFVPVLEDARLIGKLDVYIIDRVASMIHDRIVNGCSVLPVSLNLSQLDFVLINPLARIEEAVKQYQIPRKYLHVEITETAFAKNRKGMAAAIANFHNAGYDVWLDDFGSEYSSLNSLHNFNFDLLKIDMGFFVNFNQKSREIIASVVQMAKRLGMHTLAEGVETKEQLDFLRGIGCEKIQGYYYGRPVQFEIGLMEYASRHLEFEQEEEVSLYEKAGLVNLETDTPVAIFSFDGNHADMLTINSAYSNSLRYEGTIGMEDANRKLKDTRYRLQDRFRVFTRKVYEGKARTLIYVNNGHYMCLTAEKIAGSQKFWLGKASLIRIGGDQQADQISRTAYLAKNVNQFCDGLYYLDLKQNRVEVIQTVHDTDLLGREGWKADAFFRLFAQKLLHPNDRERFLSFMDPGSIRSAAAMSGRGEAQDLFRVRSDDGNYRWMVYRAILMSDDNNEDAVLICEQEDLWERYPHRSSLLPVFASSFSVAVRTDVGGTFLEPEEKKLQEGEALPEKKEQRISVPMDFPARDMGSEQYLMDFEAWAYDAVTAGLDEKDSDCALEKTISRISENLHADRFLIFEDRGDGTCSCVCEWHRSGLTPLKEELQSLLVSRLDPLYRIFEHHQGALIPDFEKFCSDHPDLYLPIAGIRNLMVGRLRSGGKILGFSLAINSSTDKMQTSGFMMAMLTEFLTMLLRISNSEEARDQAQYYDAQTHTMNLHGFETRYPSVDTAGSTALILGDINHLRKINDQQGHEAGNDVIRRTGDILMRIAGSNSVARMGGDEFLVLEENMDEVGARQMLEKIRSACTAEGISIALGMAVRFGPVTDMDDFFREANDAMLRDKQAEETRR